MSSWIHLFSKFTDEALLFQGLIICSLGAVYTAFWILKKRTHGVVHKKDVPAGVVKAYLNELSAEAHLLRTQLFGLICESGGTLPELQTGQLAALLSGNVNIQPAPAPAASPAPATAPTEGGAPDPALQAKLQELEQKLSEQSSALGKVESEKSKLENELKLAQEASKDQEPLSGDAGDLQKRIRELEERLAEYSVIEDDLANLKRLQQENEKLKAALEGKGGSTDDAPAAEAAPAEEAPVEAPAAEAAPAEEAAAEAPAEEAAEPAEAAEEDAPAEDFDNLVDDVEKSLQPEEQSEDTVEAAPAEEAAEPTDAPPAEEPKEEAPAAEAAASGGDDQDDDLLAEFEKMLNS